MEPRDEDDNSIAEMSDHELFDHDDAPSSSDSSDVDNSASSDEYDDDEPDPANYQPGPADDDQYTTTKPTVNACSTCRIRPAYMTPLNQTTCTPYSRSLLSRYTATVRDRGVKLPFMDPIKKAEDWST